MNRCKFLAALAALLPAKSLPALQLPARKNRAARISAVQIWRLEGRQEMLIGVSGQRAAALYAQRYN